MPEIKSLTLGGRPLPLSIEDVDGLPLAPGSSMKFDFGFRFIHVVVMVELPVDSTHCFLKLTGDVGPLPFTAESPDARDGVALVLARANRHLPNRFKVINGKILVGGDAQLETALHATALISSIIRILLPTLPYLELISEFVRPPLAPARTGEPPLRPAWRAHRQSDTALPA